MQYLYEIINKRKGQEKPEAISNKRIYILSYQGLGTNANLMRGHMYLGACSPKSSLWHHTGTC